MSRTVAALQMISEVLFGPLWTPLNQPLQERKCASLFADHTNCAEKVLRKRDFMVETAEGDKVAAVGFSYLTRSYTSHPEVLRRHMTCIVVH